MWLKKILKQHSLKLLSTLARELNKRVKTWLRSQKGSQVKNKETNPNQQAEKKKGSEPNSWNGTPD